MVKRIALLSVLLLSISLFTAVVNAEPTFAIREAHSIFKDPSGTSYFKLKIYIDNCGELTTPSTTGLTVTFHPYFARSTTDDVVISLPTMVIPSIYRHSKKIIYETQIPIGAGPDKFRPNWKYTMLINVGPASAPIGWVYDSIDTNLPDEKLDKTLTKITSVEGKVDRIIKYFNIP